MSSQKTLIQSFLNGHIDPRQISLLIGFFFILGAIQPGRRSRILTLATPPRGRGFSPDPANICTQHGLQRVREFNSHISFWIIPSRCGDYCGGSEVPMLKNLAMVVGDRLSEFCLINLGGALCFPGDMSVFERPLIAPQRTRCTHKPTRPPRATPATSSIRPC